MGRKFTRQELYDLVWSQPMKTVSASVGVSDVALAKACRKAQIPVPERGYWAKKQAGKRIIKRPLSPRFPGASDEIEVGSGGRTYWDPNWQQKLPNEPLPPPPTFAEEMSAVTERVRKMVGKVACPKQLIDPHPLIAKLLGQDEERRADYLKYGWNAPLYDKPIEKRRLRLLNAIFTACQRLGCQPSMGTSKYAQEKERETSVRVGETQVPFVLEQITAKSRGQSAEKAKERLRLVIGTHRSNEPGAKSWEDIEDKLLESFISDIVVEIIVAGETFHRQAAAAHHEWMVKRKAELQEEIRRRKAEEERKARELRAKQEEERIDRLLTQATALHQSNTIRTYVDAVLARTAEMPVQSDDLDRWAAWARNEADRIDPIKNGTVTKAVVEVTNALTDASNRETSDEQQADERYERKEPDLIRTA